MSTEYSEVALKEKLHRLTNHPDSIQSLSSWIIQNSKYRESIIRVWSKDARKESNAARIVNLLYLANDVVQNCRKVCPELKDHFFPVLESVIKHSARNPPPEIERVLPKLVKVWREREVFSQSQLRRLDDALLQGKSSAAYPTPVSSVPDLSKNNPQKELLHEEVAKNCQEILISLQRLQAPPSTEREVRIQLATFPESISCPEMLQTIRDSSQAKEVLKHNEAALPLITDYCKRLGEEMLERRNLQQLLDNLMNNVRSCVEYHEKMLRDVKKKEDRLKSDLVEVEKAFNSLPDLNAEASFISRSLPALENLFDMGILEKIAEIEHEISRTQKNKATEYHLGLLKAKLAKYRQQLLEPSGKGGGKGEGFDVMKSGDARVAMVGFPSVGKSTLLSSMTNTHSEAAGYEFTTLTCIPGVINYEGANIQLLDLPGIIEGASQGKGRGRQVIAVAKTADLILMMLDAGKSDQQRALLEAELEAVGIRLNKRPPHIYVKQKKVGGVKFTHTVPLTHCNEKLIMTVLHEYKIFNADVVFREDCTVDEFIDVIQGNRVYLTCLYVYNKIDQISIEEVDRLARLPHHVVISCEMNLNMDYLLEKIWEYLALVRVYTKKPGNAPDLGAEDGIILRQGATVEHCCHALHRTLAAQFRYAIVWGTSTKFSPQRVGIQHLLHHEDVIQIVKK
ncbi:unnamed protein product [Caenorhabditis auriculariae]|uniref:Uncharacterized protein n=1 Tax=Caenorhabditis auriculariae TaxID=2777116 RepID=A0A8S1H4E0_9PELO|nr:unnamed protein product [Caenorhabditis auriculariae]